jgi:transposase-like protein
VFIRIRGKQHLLWRAVDQDGVVLDILQLHRHCLRVTEIEPLGVV